MVEDDGGIIVRYKGLLSSIKAYILTDVNDDYNIYVNSARNFVEWQKVVDHELNHINENHFSVAPCPYR